MSRLQPKQFGQPEQLKMFMTPREIHEGWQPLDGDRHSGFDDEWDSTESKALKPRGPHNEPLETDDDLWDRKLDESQMTRSEYARHHRMKGVLNLKDGTGTDTHIERDLKQRPSYPQQRSGESTNSFYDRENSYLEPHEDAFRESRDVSLYDRIAAEGVKAPLHLTQSEGVLGKPVLGGGHHRLAAATDIDPDQLIPVVHHRNVHEAQSGRFYPYS